VALAFSLRFFAHRRFAAARIRAIPAGERCTFFAKPWTV
jgi:hypothetical protein